VQPLVLGTTVVLRRPVRHRSGCNVYFPHTISTDDEPRPAMPTDRRYRDPEYLRRQYVGRRRSARSIAEECGVSPSTVHRWLSRHEIERDEPYQDDDWLREQFIGRSRSVETIASECGVAASTVSYWLGRHGITESESFETGTCETCGDEFRYYPSVRDGQFCSEACSHEPTKRQVSVTCPNCGTEFERRASLNSVYCSPACWGEDLYVGTDTSYGGRWYRQRRRALRRDNFRCTICGITQAAHRRETGRELDVHHVVPVRLFIKWERPPSDAHELRNLRTVCRACHPDAPG